MQFINKFNLLVVILFFSLQINTAIGQTKIAGGEGYFMVGIQKIDIKNLNSLLTRYNYPSFDESFATIGGGGYGFINNFVIGGGGHGLIGRDIGNSNYKMNLTAGYGLFDLGYIVYSTTNFKLFPLFGLGGGGIDLRINEKSSLDFNDVLNNPKRGSTLTVGGLIFNFGLNGTYNIDFNGNRDEKGGLTIGFSAGYTHFLQIGNWFLFESEITGGPKIGISGFYMRFSIGGGGYQRFESEKD